MLIKQITILDAPRPKIKKWDYRFIKMAKEVSTWSKDPSTQVGAVITNEKVFVSLGFNGFPPGDPDLLCDYLNRDIKYSKVIHAEENAINFANKDLTGHTLYTYPILPCYKCAEKIILSGIKKVCTSELTWEDDDRSERCRHRTTIKLFDEAGIHMEILEFK